MERTLEEAIKYYSELAEENEKDAEQFKRVKATQDMISHCYECAKEHRQLAEWLKELKALRIAVYKLSRIPYGEYLTYKADDIWDLFGTLFADFEEEVMEYEEVNADERR